MAKSLIARKQEVVRDAIYDAAIALFMRKGFEETTVEEVAQSAGISRRSFFRYFATKDDLLAYTIAAYSDFLVSTLADCPARLTPIEMVRDTALAGIERATSLPHIRQIMDISAKSLSARQAHRAGLVQAEVRLADAFAGKAKGTIKHDFRPMMLARLTLMVVDLSLESWFRGEFRDGPSASKQVFDQLGRVLCEPGGTPDSAKQYGKEKKASRADGRRNASVR